MVQTETRKLAAIMFTDMVGFSRQMGSDEACMLGWAPPTLPEPRWS